MTTKQTDKPQAAPAAQTQAVAVARTDSEKFTNLVMREFSAAANQAIELTPYQRKLAQHLFLKIDGSLQALETKRLTGPNADKTSPIIWQNMNLKKLALDAMHRIDLGLDALVPNHIHPIPYWNSREKKYDLDLRIGYMGKDYYRRRVARVEPLNVIYELVYSTDKFRPIKRGPTNDVESYEFEICNPFDRGEVIGGFGYIIYEDSRQNTLVLVSKQMLARSRAAGNKSFWESDTEAMQLKTVVHRTMDKLGVDPAKASASLYAVEASEEAGDEAGFREERDQNANRTPIDISAAKEVPAVMVGDENAGKPVEEEPPF